MTEGKNNVLTKIIIPKLKHSIKYQLCELEEREREEIFRLKRFKQMKEAKRKGEEHVCSCCLAMFASEEKVIETVCPLCKKRGRGKGRSTELKLNIVPCRSKDNLKENKKRLEHLMSHIDDVIDLTKQYKIEGIVSPSIEKFIRSCNQVKEKIEDYANAQPLCDMCKKALSTGKVSAARIGSSRSMNIPCVSDRPTEEPPCFDSTYNLTPETEDKLGHFEKKFKEIVKVTRLQNEDGTISEEKQVITIKTERRNPRKPKTFDGTESSEIFGSFGGGGGHGGDGRGPYCTGPREIKSDHAHRSQLMTEPRLRSCISACHPKLTTNKDVSTNFDGGSCFSMKASKVALPPEDQLYDTHKETAKISQSTSLETCCPKKSVSVCGGELSKIYIQGLQKAVSHASIQACCKEIKIKKPVEDKSTCCFPICNGDQDCPAKTEKQEDKTKTISTNALWRDTWTSTSDLNTTPSKDPSRKPSTNISSYSRNTNKDSEKVDTLKRADSCCTIKIIMKPPKVCTFEEKLEKKKLEAKTEAEKQVVLRGSMFEALKRMILPSYTPVPGKTESTMELEMKNICKKCITKLNSTVPSKKSSVSTAKRYEAEADTTERDLQSCPSYGTLAMSTSFDIGSNRSVDVGSASELGHTCIKSPTPSLHSQKHVCCLAKVSSEASFVSTCCDLGETKSQKSVCCAKSKSSTAPCFKDTAGSGRSSATNCSAKDATTCTKRSARFDVRPLRRKHTCEKISLKDCSCRSDPHMPKNRAQYYTPDRKSRSFHENDYYYFRW